jgi:hypothetical protein
MRFENPSQIEGSGILLMLVTYGNQRKEHGYGL